MSKVKFPAERLDKLKPVFIALFAALFPLILSCNSIFDSLPGKDKEGPDNYTAKAVTPIERKQDESENASTHKVQPVKIEGHSVSEHELGALDETKKTAGADTQHKPFYEYYSSTQDDFQDKNSVRISFNAAPIEEVVPAFSKILDFSFYLDPEIKGLVTVSIEGNLSKAEVWKIFEQILIFNNSYCSIENGIVNIRPLNYLPQEKINVGSDRFTSNVSVTLFRLKNVKSADLAQQIKPFMSNGAVIVDIADQNSLLVVEVPGNMPKIRSIIGMLDVNSKFNWERAVIKCNNISASAIANELSKVMPVLGLPVEYNQPDDSSQQNVRTTLQTNPGEFGAINLQPIDRLQLLVVSAANDEVLGEVKKWVDVLDKSDVGDQDQIYIYNVRNSSAEDLIQTLSIIFNVEGATLTASQQSQSSSASTSASSSGSSSGSSGSSPFSTSMRATAYDVTQVSSQNQQQGGQGSDSQYGLKTAPTNIFDFPMKIMADAKNQRLVIRCTPRTYSIVKALLDRIDTMPPQVLLSITVADVTLSNDLEVGIQGRFKSGNNTYGTSYGLGETFAGPKGSGGGSWVYSSNDAQATLRALLTEKKITMLANPEILVQSNSLATVSIGQSVSIQTGQTTNNQGTSSSYEYKDVGIIVKVTPKITKGGLINLDFSQTNSKIDTTTSTDTGNPNPTITQEVLNTVMNLPDGGTIVIGGLVKSDITESLATIPIIGNIPILNRLVGDTQVNKTRTEMLVLVTANIINKTSDIEQMTERYQNSVKLIKQGYSKDFKDNSQVFKPEDTNKIFIKGD